MLFLSVIARHAIGPPADRDTNLRHAFLQPQRSCADRTARMVSTAYSRRRETSRLAASRSVERARMRSRSEASRERSLPKACSWVSRSSRRRLSSELRSTAASSASIAASSRRRAESIALTSSHSHSDSKGPLRSCVNLRGEVMTRGSGRLPPFTPHKPAQSLTPEPCMLSVRRLDNEAPRERRKSDSARQPRPHGQRHSRAIYGRGRSGEVRSPRLAYGRGRYRDGLVHKIPEIRSGRPQMARPRPFRAFGWSRLDAALFAAPPFGLHGDDARRNQAFSP